MDFDTHLKHLVSMALHPGTIDQARYRAKELEATYPGLTEAVRSALEVKRSEQKQSTNGV